MNLEDLNVRTLPSQMRFSDMTPLGLASKSKKIKFLPNNGGPFSNVSNIIRIPISSASAFLDPSFTTLKFTYTNNSGATVQFDSSANSVIQRIRLISASGGDLEDIRHYGYLVSMLSDLQYSLYQRFTKSYEGYGYNGVVYPAISAGAQIVANQIAIPAVTEASLGTGEISMANNTGVTVILPILSSLIGTSARKYLPLFLTGQIMLEIELANLYSPFVTVGADANMTGYQVSAVELHCQMVEFDADVNQSLIQMSMKNGLFLHGNSWASFFNAAANANPSLVISERLKSVKSLFTCFSLTPADSQTRHMARHHGGVTGLSFTIGSDHYPNQPISGTASDYKTNCEYLLETLKAIGEYGNVMHQSIINPVNFASPDVSATSVGRAVYGIDLDAFSKSPIESGVNTVLNNPITINVTNPGTAGLVNYTFLLYDVIFHITPDGQFVAAK